MIVNYVESPRIYNVNQLKSGDVVTRHDGLGTPYLVTDKGFVDLELNVFTYTLAVDSGLVWVKVQSAKLNIKL